MCEKGWPHPDNSLRPTGSIWPWPALESLPRGRRIYIPSGRLQTTSEQDPLSSRSRTLPLLRQNLLCVVSIHTGAGTGWPGPFPIGRQPKGWPHSQRGQQQSRLNYNRKAHISHGRDIPGAPCLGDKKNKMAINTYLSITALNVNAPIKRHTG